MSISGGLARALFRGQELGCEVIQLFTRNPNRWASPSLSPQEIRTFHEARAKTSVVPIASHDGYLINMASPKRERRRRSMEALREELIRSHLLGIRFVVIHPGAHLGGGEREGIRLIAEGLDRVLALVPCREVEVLLESTAGQGTSLGYRLEHLAEIISRTESNHRLGICLDTCHLFAAGYDFRDREGLDRLLEEVDGQIGLGRLKLVHANDSKRAKGSRIDRHEHIGQGCIGVQAFSCWINSPALRETPFILETPKGRDALGRDLDWLNLNILKRLREEPGSP